MPEPRGVPQLRESQRILEDLIQSHVDHHPARIVGVGLGIVVRVLRVERGVVGIRFLDDRRDSDNGRRIGVGVINQNAVTDLHVVADEVSRLIISQPGALL